MRNHVIAGGLCLAMSQVAGASCVTDLMAQPADSLAASVKDPTAEYLSHGSGCYSVDPDTPDSCDVRTTLDTDRRIAADRRLLVFTYNHETGSGARSDVRIYGCSAGAAKILFAHEFYYGVTIERSTPDEIVLTGGHWAANDPACCPSARERYVIKWDPKELRYLKPEVQLLPLKDK
jgi:hypothetical protein